jgi:hypothetical protein
MENNIIKELMNVKEFILKNTIKLNKESRDTYLGVITYEEFQKWNIDVSPELSVSEFIQVFSNDVSIIRETKNSYDVTVKNGLLVNTVSDSRTIEEFPVLITNKIAVNIILEALLNVKSFNRIIEVKNSKISINSSKVMTLTSLERIVHNVFKHISFEEAIILTPKLKIYIKEVISSNDNLRVSSVEELKNIKKRSVINSTFSWYIIFSYFIDKNRGIIDVDNLQIPKIDKNVTTSNWSGTFFDKDNPMWKELFNTKRMFYPTKESLKGAYDIWLKEI